MVSEAERLRQRLERLPNAVSTDYLGHPPNKNIPVYEGEFTLKQNSTSLRMKGCWWYRWLPRPDLRFSGTAQETVRSLEPGKAILYVPRKLRAGAFVNKISGLGSGATVTGGVSGTPFLGENRSAVGVRFHLTNFHAFRAGLISFAENGDGTETGCRLNYRSAHWHLILDQMPDYREYREGLKASGGYGIGHVGLAKRSAGQTINQDDARELFTLLHFYFSFLRGMWCGPTLNKGVGQTTELWSAWPRMRATPWKGVESWFPTMVAADTDDLFGKFTDKWETNTWNEGLRYAIHWYVEANLNAGALEGSLVLATTGLELLAWLYLVESTRKYSTRKFKPLGFDAKIRELLAELDIESSIPGRFSDLRSYSKTHRLKDGPAGIQRLRNAIVHPRRHKRSIVAETSRHVRYELIQLSLSYLELSLLAILGYKGRFSPRTGASGGPGGFVLVPWET